MKRRARDPKGSPKAVTAQVITRPAPTLGWNARDSVANMKPGYAIQLVNWFPDGGRCSIRGGSVPRLTLGATSPTAINEAIKTLAVYNPMDGNNKMFAVNDYAVYKASSSVYYLKVPGETSGDYASTPDSATVSVTGDIDVRVLLSMGEVNNSIAPVIDASLCSKSNATGNQRSWEFLIEATTGRLKFRTYSAGTAASVVTATSTAAPRFDVARDYTPTGSAIWVRAVRDVNNGASGNTTYFYQSHDGRLWIQIGTSVVNSGTTSIFDSTATLNVGPYDTGGVTGTLTSTNVHRAKVYSGYGSSLTDDASGTGTLVADFSPTDASGAGATSLTSSSTGEVWTINGSALISGPVAPPYATLTVDNYLNLPGTAGNYASTPDSATLDILGDLDIIAYIKVDDWTPVGGPAVGGKWDTTGNQRSYLFSLVGGTGVLRLNTSTLGTGATVVNGDSTVVTGFADGSGGWVRVTLDVDDGAGNRVYKFYISTQAPTTALSSISWTQLGATVTTAGTTSVFAGTADLLVGAQNAGTGGLYSGKTYRFVVYSGIGGTKIAEFNAFDTYAGDTSFASMTTGETWTIAGTAAIAGTGVASRTDGRCYWTNFGDGTTNWLIICNRPDKPIYYDGTSFLAISATTSPALTGVTTTKLIQPNVFKGRLFFVEKDSLSVWYLAAGAAGGALTEFDFSSIMSKGGYIMFMATWTRDGGSGPDDYAVFMSSEGEIAVYSGTNPSSASTWAKVGTYYTGVPLGRRAFVQIDNDLVLITQNGAFTISSITQGKGLENNVAISSLIAPEFNRVAINRDANNNLLFGWEGVLYPRQSAVIFNYPTDSGVTQTFTNFKQFVMNSTTKAWCQFQNWSSISYVVFNEELYFSTNFQVKKAWAPKESDIYYHSIGACDAWGISAFDRLGTAANKEIKMFKSDILTDGNTKYEFSLWKDYQFLTGQSTQNSSASYFTFNTDLSDENLLLNAWSSSSIGVGFCFAAHTYVINDATYNVNAQWLSTTYVYESGGIL